MKVFTLFIALFLFVTVSTAFAQLRDMNTESFIHEPDTLLPLNPDLILNPVTSADTDRTFQFLGTKTSHTLLHLGADIIENKFDLDFGTPSFTSSPRTVSEFNNSVRRQTIGAEPIYQRRSPTLFRFN